MSSQTFSLQLPQDKYTQIERINLSKRITKNGGTCTFSISRNTIVIIDDEIIDFSELQELFDGNKLNSQTQ